VPFESQPAPLRAGSDEHDGRVACQKNKCIAMGSSFRTELAEKVRRAKGGFDRKRVLVAAAPTKRDAWQKEIDQLAIEIELQKLTVGLYKLNPVDP
jgi:hypothetical protein